MAVSRPQRSYVIYEPDIAAAKFEVNQQGLRGRRDGTDPKAQRIPVRRPYSSIRLKEETFAVLSVLGLDNKPIPLASPLQNERVTTDSETASAGVTDYTDFILQQVQDQRAEKQQIVDTFGDFFVFFFGEQPRVLNFGGVLLNTEDFNWRSQFWYNYDNYFRGTKLVQLNARAYLAWDTIVVEGYPFNASANEVVDEPNKVQFNMSMLVTNYFDYSDILHVTSVEGKSIVQDYEDIPVADPTGPMQPYKSTSKQITVDEWLTTLGVPLNDTLYGEWTKNQDFIASMGTQYTAFGIPSTQVRSSAEIQAQIFKHNLLLQTNVRWQLSRVMGGITDAINQGASLIPVQQFYAGVHNVFSQAGGVVDDLAMQASIATRNFGMFASRTFPPLANAASLIADPATMIRSMMGMSMPKPGELTESPTNSIMYHKNRVSAAVEAGGATTKRNQSTREGGYVGSTAQSTFSRQSLDIQARIANGEIVQLEMGEAFKAHPYSTQGDTPAYEDVYGDRDYTQAVAENEIIEQSLQEAHGDVDSAIPGEKQEFEQEIDPYRIQSTVDPVPELQVSDVDPESLEDVYSTGVTSKFRRSAEEILAALREAQSTTRVALDEDTRGIRGVDDVIIEPVV